MSAEYAVIGSLLHDNDSFWKVADKITADDFADAMCRRVFALVGDQLREGKPADAVTLGNAGGASVLDWCIDAQANAYSSASILHHADIVRNDAERRRLHAAGFKFESYDEALSKLATVRPTQTARVKSMRDGLAEMVDALQRRYDADGDVSGTPTGIESLDEITSGWQAGNLIVVAARPAMGKSAFALQAALTAGRTFFASLEMTAGELAERAVSNQGQFPLRWIRFPKDAPDHAGLLVLETSKRVSAMPLLIDDSTGLSADAICSRIRQAHMVEPLKLAIVDHLGLIDRPGKHDPSELGLITSALKRLAKELGIAVMLLCQLNRKLEERGDKRPTLSDLRDSGRIEEDADVVIGLYRDEYYKPHGELAGYLEAIILKNRSGEQGTAWAKSLLASMRLESCDEPERSVSEIGGNANTGGFQSRATQSRNAGTVSRVHSHHG